MSYRDFDKVSMLENQNRELKNSIDVLNNEKRNMIEEIYSLQLENEKLHEELKQSKSKSNYPKMSLVSWLFWKK